MGLFAVPKLQCAGSGPRLILVRLIMLHAGTGACDGWFPDTFNLHTITPEHRVSVCMNFMLC